MIPKHICRWIMPQPRLLIVGLVSFPGRLVSALSR